MITTLPSSPITKSLCYRLQTLFHFPLAFISLGDSIRGPTTPVGLMFCFFCTRRPSSRHSSSTCASSVVDYPAPSSRYRRAGSTYVIHHKPSSSPRYGSTSPARRTHRHRLVQRRPRRRLRYVYFPSVSFLFWPTLRVARHVLAANGSRNPFELSRCSDFDLQKQY